jgi:hypothetical protein
LPRSSSPANKRRKKEAHAYAHLTLKALLDAASITPTKWKKWKEKADLKETPEDKEKAMRESIGNQL